MPKVTYLQTNFTAGELSPRVHGRVDIAKYQNGVEEMRDAIVEIYGGAKRRPSSLFVRETKNSANEARLIPFVRNSDTAYMLEFGNLYVRVYKDGAIVESSPGVPYEIVSPYTTAQVLALDFTQGADTMFLFHQSVTPYKLVCAGDTSWTLSAVAFINTPYDEVGTYPAATLTPERAGPVGDTIVLAAGTLGDSDANTGLTWSAGVVSVTCVGHGLASGDVVQIVNAIPSEFNTSASVVTVTGADTFTFALPTNPGSATQHGTSTVITAASVFGSGDVGKTVKINGGRVKVTSVVGNNVLIGVIKGSLNSSAAAPQDAWSLHSAAWTAGNGYPRTGTLHEQRLICGGSPAYPQTIWGSVTGAYLDFQQGTDDDEAFAFTIASNVVNPIKYMASNRGVLLAFTAGGEFTIQGGTEKPLTPTNAQIKLRRNFGCAEVRPVHLRDAHLFVQRAGRKVLSFGYSLANDDWTAPDVSVLSEHLTEGGIGGLCWQQEPDSIIWLYREDGALLSITFDKDQDVTAWEYHEGFGRDGAVFVESIASIPLAAGDEVWMIVRRTIGGSTKRYVERLSENSTMDCGIVATGASATVWSGLTHLNGETVHAVGDDRYLGTYTVAGGSVTLNRACTAVNIGLGYTPRLKLLPPEIQTGMGSASGNAMRTSEVTVRFYRTTGCKINGKAMNFVNLGAGLLDEAPQEFTGVKRQENLGFDRGESVLEFTQDEPMPFHILSVTRKLTTNDG